MILSSNFFIEFLIKNIWFSSLKNVRETRETRGWTKENSNPALMVS